MSTSTPPAWNWLEEKYVPAPYPAAFATMADDQYESLALSTDSRNLSSAATLRAGTDTCHICLERITGKAGKVLMHDGRAYHNACFRLLAVEPDVSVEDQCPDCRCAPNMAHSPECDVSSNPVVSCNRKDDATGCDCATKVTDSAINDVPEHCDGARFGRETPTKLPVDAPNEHRWNDHGWVLHEHPDCWLPTVPDTASSDDVTGSDDNQAWICGDCGQDRYGPHIAMSTWHHGRCGICGETKAVTEARDFGNRNYNDPTCTVTAPETTSPADSYRVRCPVCCQQLDNDEAIFCDHCEEPIGVESFAVTNGPGGVFVYHLHCYDEVYWADGHDTGQEAPESRVVEDEESVPCGHWVGEDGICGYWNGGNHGPNACTRCGLSPCECDVEPHHIPFKVQEWMFESLAEYELDKLHDLIDDNHDRILEMARDRFRDGYAEHGSQMYSWTPKRRLSETLQELADAVVYPTSGPLE